MGSYRNRYKFNAKPSGFNIWEKIKLKKIVMVLNLMVEGYEWDNRKIFREHPHSTWDPYFNEDPHYAQRWS